MASFSKIPRILSLVVIIAFSFCRSVMAQTQTDGESDGTPVEIKEPVNEYDFKPEIGKIDEAGNKVGERIEAFGAKASDR